MERSRVAKRDPRAVYARSSRWRAETERWGWPRETARPHPVLRPLLTRDYWGISADAGPHQLLIPASASVPVVLKLDDSPHRPPAFLHGVHDRFAVMDGDCAPTYLEISMAPLGAYRMLGRPVRELGGEVVDLMSVFGASGGRLLEAVREQPTWAGRFAVVDSFLLRAAERGPRPAPEVSRAWQLLTDTGGTIPIGAVAAEVGWSRKHLIAKFVEQIGLTPKTVARLTRFERVLARVRGGRAVRWSQVATETGYADQPHLIREFRDFAGTTPAGYPDTVAAEAKMS
jgi:AraC-like DNA-binding protein